MNQQPKASEICSNRPARAFEKRGRPREDRAQRQREIYDAIAPLVLRCGVARLSMAAAARATYLSVGGIYHYFPSKQALVLHGLQPATLKRYCDDRLPAFASLAQTDPQGYLLAYCDHMLRLIAFIRPACHAAVELGLATVQTTIDASLASGLEQFIVALRAAFPGLPAQDVTLLARTVRRLCLGAVWDSTARAEDVRGELWQLLESVRNRTVLVDGGICPLPADSARELLPAADDRVRIT